MAELRGRRGHARVVVMSIIDAEMQAVKTIFNATEEIGTSGVFTAPEYASSDLKYYPFVVAKSADRSNTPAHSSARQLLEWYRPEVVLVVGIGGGINRNAESNPPMSTGPGLGDVVIGRYVHYAEYTKNLPNGTYLRYISIDQPSSQLVSQHAETLAASPRAGGFAGLSIPRPDNSSAHPKIHVGELVALESIAGNPTAEKQIEMLSRFDNADVVDMESMGVGRALHDTRDNPFYSPVWLPVRGVSDLVTAERPPLTGRNENGSRVLGALADNNTQRATWKGYACLAAACVGLSLVQRILHDEREPSAADPGAPRWRTGLDGAKLVGG
ncbi:phosphorylase family protein [Rhodococcus sp. MEB064]|uniref:phosphorylase family protein n=1 Tax=Rhodococcus sp. MEB064 TaxID=1587522 RepID=UPI0009E61510|nr:hypothetical protein [Rhodococcus sp. MEB064]